ncbi:MAG: TIGR04211 family SH3 domain-containing protein [Deltaproteobacteria bacterium]|nr:TIGR04211 family SH3 domain-containing protein [Deltaproteobacteria bacterium]
MKKFLYIYAFILFSFFLCPLSWAADAYVSDSVRISLYMDPGTESEVIAELSSGDSVDIITTHGDWTLVRFAQSGGEEKTGFILSRYLTSALPWKIKAGPINEENQRLMDKISAIKKQLLDVNNHNVKLSEKLKETRDAIQQINKEYQSMRINASDYLKLKDSYEKNFRRIERMNHQIQKLSEDNQRLRTSHTFGLFRWEALLLIVGLVIGVAIGHLEKRNKYLYF